MSIHPTIRLRDACIASALLFLAGFGGLAAQSLGPCRDCPLPREEQWSSCLRDSVLNLTFKENRPSISGVRSIRRETLFRYGRPEQALKVQYFIDGVCRDTLVMVAESDRLRAVNLGLCGNPVGAPIFPAREFHREEGMEDAPMSFFEIAGVVGYAGEDQSTRQTGFDGFHYGVQGLIGGWLGERLRAGIGGGVTFEGGRMRIPLLGQLRWTFFGSSRVEEYFNYFPSACQFGEPGQTPVAPDGDGIVEVPATVPTDPTVYFFHDRRRVSDPFRPFLYAEGGIILNGRFEGSGADPAINNEDYGQYLAGGGVGVPFLGFATAAIGYRYMRLNLRTACPACEEEFLVNTSQSHSVLLTLGGTFDF
jgi:hypothetical protein